jgi:hypothetical protein
MHSFERAGGRRGGARRWAGLAGLMTACSLCCGCLIPDIEIPRFSYYKIDSEPQGAHVFMRDGTYEGKTPTAFTLRTEDVFVGEWSVRVVKSGYREREFKWTARCDKITEKLAMRDPHHLMVFLEPETTPEEMELPPLPPEQRLTLAVIDFDVGEEIADDTGQAAADLCRQALAEAQQYKLMDRNNVKSVLGEQDFAAAVRCDTTQCLVDYGRLLHVQRMVHGRIVRLGDEYTLHMGMTDVNTSELVSQVTSVVPSELEQLREIVPAKAYELVVGSLQGR